MYARRGKDREGDDNRTGEEDGRYGARETGPRTGKQQRRWGRAPREGRPGGERQRERGMEWRESGGFGGIRDGGG